MWRRMLGILFAAALALPLLAHGRPRLEKDECSRKSAECEKRCAKDFDGQAQLSCKTDCRLEESRCRSGKR